MRANGKEIRTKEKFQDELYKRSYSLFPVPCSLFPVFSIWPVAGCGAAGEAFIQRLAVFEARFARVPVLDSRLRPPPAQKHHLIVQTAGKIQQPGVQGLPLHADSVDLRYALP